MSTENRSLTQSKLFLTAALAAVLLLSFSRADVSAQNRPSGKAAPARHSLTSMHVAASPLPPSWRIEDSGTTPSDTASTASV